jgi:hypothetical protein
MTRRERLMATLKGEVVDRPAVNFYETGGFLVNPEDPDKYNIYNSKSWRPLLNLAENHTDLIRMVSPVRARSHLSWSRDESTDIRKQFINERIWEDGISRYTCLIYKTGDKELTTISRRDRNIDTVWIIEPLLKNPDDVKVFLQLPDEIFEENLDIDQLEEQEKKLGDRGIVMVDTEDPVCAVASLFSLEAFTIIALTEKILCHKLLEKHARYIHKRTEKVAREFPGRLWRIYGPEYITEPFLPPSLFDEYVVKYTGPMVKQIKNHGGFARIHAHGCIKNVLDYIINMGADAIDPIEPPPHGDVALKLLRRKYGKEIVLFGNIEVSDVENMPNGKFRRIVKQTIADGTSGEGRGFVLMPSASPYGRNISKRTLRNYQIMIEEIERI